MAGTKVKSARKARWAEYTTQPDAMDTLCAELVEHGAGLYTWCTVHDYAYTAVRDWIESDPIRSAAYACAREDRADVMAEDIIRIADEMPPADGETGRMDSAWVAWQRGRVDARKWSAAKLKPRTYGESTQVKLGGDPNGIPLQTDMSLTISFVTPPKIEN